MYLKSEFYWIVWIVDIKKKQCFLANNDAHLNARKSKKTFFAFPNMRQFTWF
jgi:hypothetical protein